MFFTHALTLSLSLFLLCTQTNALSNSSVILPLTASAYGTSFDVEVEIGNQSFKLIADTGSSDLWVLDSDWQCLLGSPTTPGAVVPKEKCQYSNTTYTRSPTFQPITAAWLGEHYGVGNVVGPLGTDLVRVGGLSIPSQTFGLANSSSAYGDGVCSGLIGLGYQDIASIHPANYTATNALQLLGDRLVYDTFLVNLMKSGVEPFFAMALERTPIDQQTGLGGYLSFGTLPPVDYGDFVTAPVEITNTIPASFTNGTKKITEWTLTVQSVTWNNKTSNTSFQAVVDSGNGINVLPQQIAADVNAAFDPPAIFDKSGPQGGAYSVQCNATPPADFGIEIAGKVFSMNASDMIWRDTDGACYSSISSTAPLDGIELLFLGDAFLKNVVAVFDMGHNEMRFAARNEKSTSSNSGSDSPPSKSAASSRAAQLCLMVVGLLASCLSVV